ncbi:MAG: AmmeMemoRadiSam system protein B [Candidatus Omnitrophica bacterium]|nr:AmmeMemoRadiSam system protein B [Candidatus Omnitrophota bacterium]
MIRKPVVEGQFYPKKINEIATIIENFRLKQSSRTNARGIVMPHAGYIYSGRVAATTVNQVQPKKKIIILGPNHSGHGKNFALWAKGSWKISDNNVKIDETIAQSILKEDGLIEEDYGAHEFEHSIEVQLPILHYFFKEFEFVPITCKLSTLNNYRQCANQIFQAVKKIKEDILLIASTDMTHYQADARARSKDRLAIEKIIDLDDDGLLKIVAKENISMCGAAPTAILIACLKQMGARKAQVTLYQTSGDTGGDKESVVGYAGIIIQ